MAIVFKEDYVKMDEMYEGKTYKMAANTLLTWPTDIDSSRLYMNTSETKQSLTLLNPDVPRLSTGWENVLGKLNRNRSYKRLEGIWEVKDIIRKYAEGDIFSVVFYQPSTNTWDIIEKPIAENLQEKFGYVYNAERMDQLKVGDVLQDEVIYKSTAYDENMNYRYGKNAKVWYTTSTDTIEDAVKIRVGWAEGVHSVEVDSVKSPVNNNHVPLNLYGDDENYQSFPKFHQLIKDSTVFATRPINNDRILIDFQNDALREVNPTTDSDYVISEAIESEIYDIDIFYNGEDPFPDTTFFHQLKEVYDEQEEYVRKVLEWTVRIKESGDNYTANIPFYKSKYQHWSDPEWPTCGKEKNKPFGYMTVVFHTKSILGIVPGSKMAGRFGEQIALIAERKLS